MAYKLGDFVTYRTKNGAVEKSGTVIGLGWGDMMIEWEDQHPANLILHTGGGNHLYVRKESRWNCHTYKEDRFDSGGTSYLRSSMVNKRSKCLSSGIVAYTPSQIGDRDDDI